MKPMRVFFGQPIDFLEKSNIQGRLDEFQDRTRQLQIEVVAPYEDDLDRDLDQAPLGQDEARSIVRKDLDALQSSHVLVADVSQEDRQAIGMLFEIAHAERMNKYIIVHAGDSSISKRVWIQACANRICETWEEVVDELSQIASGSVMPPVGSAQSIAVPSFAAAI